MSIATPIFISICMAYFFVSPHFVSLDLKWVSCAAATAAKSLQSCPTLWDPIEGSPPGSAVPGIFQARVQEWVAIAFSIDNEEKQNLS